MQILVTRNVNLPQSRLNSDTFRQNLAPDENTVAATSKAFGEVSLDVGLKTKDCGKPRSRLRTLAVPIANLP